MPMVERGSIIAEATADVLESMCFIEVLGDIPEMRSPGADWISAKLYFNGPRSGELGISAAPSTVKELAANFLGEDPTQLDSPECLEFLCELSNMICGSLLGRLKQESIYILSHPINSPYLPNSQPNCTFKTFRVDGGELFVWLSVETKT